MSSVFGDFETPKAKQPESAPRRLVELELRAHKKQQLDERSKAVPVVTAVFDKPSNTVHMRVEARTSFDDGTTGQDVKVSFFVNGNRVADIATDDFGLAVLDANLDANLFRMNPQADEVTARVRGFSRESSLPVAVGRKSLEVEVSYKWTTVLDDRPPNWNYRGLVLSVKATTLYGVLFKLDGIQVVIERHCAASKQWTMMGESSLDGSGHCIFDLPHLYCNERETKNHYDTSIPDNIASSWAGPAGPKSAVVIRVVGWPVSLAEYGGNLLSIGYNAESSHRFTLDQ